MSYENLKRRLVVASGPRDEISENSQLWLRGFSEEKELTQGIQAGWREVNGKVILLSTLGDKEYLTDIPLSLATKLSKLGIRLAKEGPWVGIQEGPCFVIPSDTLTKAELFITE